MPVDQERIQKLNRQPERPERKYVLYWAQMNRRVSANHGLLFAAEAANRCQLPLLVYESLTCSYEYANDRLYTFILEAVPDTENRLAKLGIGYIFYLRKTTKFRDDVLYELAKDAALIVTDDYPVFIAAAHNRSIPNKVDIAYYAVDSSCIVPMSCIPERQYAAYTIRPRISRLLPKFLRPADALQLKHKYIGSIPSFHTKVTKENLPSLVAGCDIDHSVPPSLTFRGGSEQAESLLLYFLKNNLQRFADDRNQPTKHATSGLSPYLHFGHISSLEIALAVQNHLRTTKEGAEAYLEELIVRRELSFNYARHVKDPGSLQNLPEWCRQNMKKHARDEREHLYTPRQFEQADTADALWNSAQKEMLLRGKIHGYYRMYWGKKIIEWSRSYEEAARTMIDIHGRYALDGRDPNTFANILWCFGLHDRAWPERPVFGKMRYMSFEGMKRKTDTQAYIDEIDTLEKTGKDVVTVT